MWGLGGGLGVIVGQVRHVDDAEKWQRCTSKHLTSRAHMHSRPEHKLPGVAARQEPGAIGFIVESRAVTCRQDGICQYLTGT